MKAIPCALLLLVSVSVADVLEVGPGRDFARIEEAYEAAAPGDTIAVHPREGNAAYERVMLYVKKARLTFRAVVPAGGPRIPLSGEGREYTGKLPVPRALLEFGPDADGCTIEGFELFGARNRSKNGAGLRINQANDVTIRDCDVHGNDMGIMSNGDTTPEAGVNQRIEGCLVHHNSSPRGGRGHNLYLGGTSVTLSACQIYASDTGHNVKSRAHFLRVEWCLIHSAGQRELDLVGREDTDRPGSDTILVGNVIVKDPACGGNRGVIHFGRESRRWDHDGTIHLLHNTIVTPFNSPVLDLSAPGAKAHLVNNLVWDAGRGPLLIVRARDGAELENVTGRNNWFASGVGLLGGTRITQSIEGKDDPPFADPGARDFRLVETSAEIVDRGARLDDFALPPVPGAANATRGLRVFVAPAGARERPVIGLTDLGAYELEKGE